MKYDVNCNFILVSEESLLIRYHGWLECHNRIFQRHQLVRGIHVHRVYFHSTSKRFSFSLYNKRRSTPMSWNGGTGRSSTPMSWSGGSLCGGTGRRSAPMSRSGGTSARSHVHLQVDGTCVSISIQRERLPMHQLDMSIQIISL